MFCQIAFLHFRKALGLEVVDIGCALEGGVTRYKSCHLSDLDGIVLDRNICFRIGGSTPVYWLPERDVERIAHFREHVSREIACMVEKGGRERIALEWQFALHESEASVA